MTFGLAAKEAATVSLAAAMAALAACAEATELLETKNCCFKTS
jgi:hypothetical protein